jgi:hypothetical protein
MTKRESLKNILKNKPEAEAKFMYYFKYEFWFSSEGIEFSIGGDSGEIYRLDVDPVMKLSRIIELVND